MVAEEHDVEQRDADRIEEDADPGEGHDLVVLGRAALDGEVRPQEGAVVELLAREGLEGGGAHHREDQEAERE